jgi:hypothetical protein
MRTRALVTGSVLAAAALAGGVATGLASQEEGPRAPIPRVCWFSDYENAKLSNQCEYRGDERRWYMRVDGKTVPADTQKLPPANLCLYFHGTECPERRR